MDSRPLSTRLTCYPVFKDHGPQHSARHLCQRALRTGGSAQLFRYAITFTLDARSPRSGPFRNRSSTKVHLNARRDQRKNPQMADAVEKAPTPERLPLVVAVVFAIVTSVALTLQFFP